MFRGAIQPGFSHYYCGQEVVYEGLEMTMEFMKRVSFLLLLAILLLPAYSRQPSAEKADLADNEASWRKIDSEFLNPPNDCRIVQYGGHDGSIVPIGKMREYGIGGVQLFMSVHNYLRNEEAWAAMITNIREAKKAGMQVWVGDDNGYPSTQAGGLVVAADPKFELRVLAQLSQRGNGPQPVRIDLPPAGHRLERGAEGLRGIPLRDFRRMGQSRCGEDLRADFRCHPGQLDGGIAPRRSLRLQ